MKTPSFQFYPGDWRKDPGVQALSYHDRGVWFEILCLMHESEPRGKLLLNGKAMPDEALARLLGLDNQNLTTTLTTLITYGVASRCEDTGALMCRRMVRDEHLRNIRRNAGKLGGNPKLVNQNKTTGDNQNSTPSSSSSSSSSDKNNMSGKPDPAPKNGELKKQARTILEFLNQKTGRNYQPVDGTLTPIVARLKEGFTEAQCRQVIAKKCRKWGTDEKMEPYLRPKTLFNKTNFANYVGELEVVRE